MNLREFEKWALAEGSVANPEENSFKGECVSLVQQYLNKVHGLPFQARGHAKDWANANIPGFSRYDASNEPLPGDILVYGATNTNRFGHVAIIDADGRFLEQNKGGSRKVTVGDIRPGRIMILRPTNVDLGEPEAMEYRIGQVYTTQVNLWVRNGAGVNKPVKKKSEMTADGQKNAENYYLALLKAGTRVTLLEVSTNGDDIWGRIPSGWIAFKYNGKMYVR